MKKSICSALTGLLIATSLTGCSLPGMESESDDNIMSDSYSTEESNSQAVQNYSWILEPSVSADNIVSFDGSQVDPDNEKNSAYTNYSVIRSGGKCGLIDYAGNIVAQPLYDDYYTCWCGEITLFNVVDEANGQYEYCTIDSTNQVVNYVTVHTDESSEYFWDAKTEKVYEKKKSDTFGTEYTGKKTVVVGEAQISDAGNGTFDIIPDENTLYGLAKKGKLVLDMEYTDYYAPSYKGAGLTCIALENSQGKWGYVGSDGKVIIDFKCDADVNSYSGKVIDDEAVTHPYLFTGDYVPVLVDSSYAYYDIDGNCVVKSGEFEQARPVHNGRAWVRKDGLWGVIQLGDVVEDETITTVTTKAETTTTTQAYVYTTTQATTEDTSAAETTSEAVTTKETQKQTEATTEATTTQPAETTTTEQQTQATTQPAPSDTVPVDTEAPAE